MTFAPSKLAQVLTEAFGEAAQLAAARAEASGIEPVGLAPQAQPRKEAVSRVAKVSTAKNDERRLTFKKSVSLPKAAQKTSTFGGALKRSTSAPVRRTSKGSTPARGKRSKP